MDSAEIPPVVAKGRPLLGERRLRPRLKAQIPAYTSFNGNSNGAVLDLNEILDITEDGIAIQASPPLPVNRNLNLCLHLSENKNYIHTTGHVVWSDSSGRAGIRFPDLPDPSRQQLREWLFQNALVGCTNRAASADGEGTPSVADAGCLPPDAPRLAATEPIVPDFTTTLAALSVVEREVHSLGANLDDTLLLISERAKAFTRSTGAAIALLPLDTEMVELPSEMPGMVCRASVGYDAPPLGTRLQVGSGFSGECVRTGQLLRCDDSETDLLVDRESCRELGIRSMVAVPIRFGETVIGLLEVFSPLPYAFQDRDATVLQRLAETTLSALKRARNSASKADQPSSGKRNQEVVGPAWVGEPSQPETKPAEGDHRIPVPGSQLVLLILVAATLAMVLGFEIAPWIDAKWSHDASGTKQVDLQPESRLSSKPLQMKAASEARTLAELREIAEQGDAAAQFALGARYATGSEIKQDYTEAVRWFTKAAEQGHVIAQATLGAYYWAGRGIPQDLNKAYFWSILARAGGDEASKYRAAVLTSHMSRSQVVAARQEADDWLKRHQMASNSPPPH